MLPASRTSTERVSSPRGAFDAFRETSVDERARFLETIADNVADIGDELIVRAMAETGLPRARLEGERARTVGQLRLFATVVRAGSWLALRVDPAQPERTPTAARPAPAQDPRRSRRDLRRQQLPAGFLGGRRRHGVRARGRLPGRRPRTSAHPGVGELVARAIAQAAAECGYRPACSRS